MSQHTPTKQSHVTTHTKQTAMHTSQLTLVQQSHMSQQKNNQVVSHVTRNTNKTVTKPTVSSNTEGVTILKPITN